MSFSKLVLITWPGNTQEQFCVWGLLHLLPKCCSNPRDPALGFLWPWCPGHRADSPPRPARGAGLAQSGRRRGPRPPQLPADRRQRAGRERAPRGFWSRAAHRDAERRGRSHRSQGPRAAVALSAGDFGFRSADPRHQFDSLARNPGAVLARSPRRHWEFPQIRTRLS